LKKRRRDIFIYMDIKVIIVKKRECLLGCPSEALSSPFGNVPIEGVGKLLPPFEQRRERERQKSPAVRVL
jgi:hypothetical protein